MGRKGGTGRGANLLVGMGTKEEGRLGDRGAIRTCIRRIGAIVRTRKRSWVRHTITNGYGRTIGCSKWKIKDSKPDS